MYKQEVQLWLRWANCMRVSESQQMIFVVMWKGLCDLLLVLNRLNLLGSISNMFLKYEVLFSQNNAYWSSKSSKVDDFYLIW